MIVVHLRVMTWTVGLVATARGYMPWGFMATQIDMGDGEDKLGFDRSLPLHHDWDKLYKLLK